MRDAGVAVGLLRPRLLRPFPAEAVRRSLLGKRGVAVIDQNLSVGAGGIIHAEIASALYGRRDAPAALTSFIGGLGGRDISSEELFEIAEVTQRAADSGVIPPPRLLFTEDELRGVRKLQSIASRERELLERIR
jgi:pyruvate ferredoxin oxidoreductase alpha subunit